MSSLIGTVTSRFQESRPKCQPKLFSNVVQLLLIYFYVGRNIIDRTHLQTKNDLVRSTTPRGAEDVFPDEKGERKTKQ